MTSVFESEQLVKNMINEIIKNVVSNHSSPVSLDNASLDVKEVKRVEHAKEPKAPKSAPYDFLAQLVGCAIDLADKKDVTSDHIQSLYGREIILSILGYQYDVTYVGELKLEYKKTCVMKKNVHRLVLSKTSTTRWHLMSIHIDYVEPGKIIPHQCVLMIDTKEKIVEEFDPAGGIASSSYVNVLKEWCKASYPGYLFVSCHLYCGSIGLQEENDDNCWLFCMMWMIAKTNLENDSAVLFYKLLHFKEIDILYDLLLGFGNWIINYLNKIDFLSYRYIYNQYDSKHEILKSRAVKRRDFAVLRTLNAEHATVFSMFSTGKFGEMISLIDKYTR